MSALAMIPAARREAVHAALRLAFGSLPKIDLQPIKGGVSGALIFRFDVHQHAHVLRLEPERVALPDRQRGFTCMTAAAAAGAAPPVQFTDAATGVAIMDFIAGRPLSEHPGGPIGMVRALGALIARVQATPPFPTLGDYRDIVAYLLNKLSQTGFLTPGQFELLAEGLARIRAALPWDAPSSVSSHNDPNPRNILFDGERVWLVDWEMGFRNDPLVDVAILTTDLAETPGLEEALLQAAFNATPDRALRARLGIIRLLTRLFYGCVVLDSLIGTLTSAPDVAFATVSPAAFRLAVANGRLASGTPDVAYAFARMSLTAFGDGLAAPGFSEMLKATEQG
jgi:aminoglycoside phosphotransferase (APT) family kinase protein